ncbi:MAG: ligand-binding sensor domain-containing protein, partial [Paraclostridium sp.]
MGKIRGTSKFIIFSIISICIIVINTSSSYANFNFKNITIESGINQGTIEAIFQDEEGYIWLGSNDGLNRYNGYEFKLYNYNEDENSISNNYISDITQDKNGNIWVSTVKGINKIDLDTGEIKNYTKENKDIVNDNVTEIVCTKNNDIIVGTKEGIYIYDELKDSFSRILSEKNGIIDQFIYCISED